MSYDLFFKTRPGATAPTAESFADYFRSRKNYEVTDKQAVYTNESTGIYFIFDLGGVEEGEPGSAPVSFNLNYFRPHTFGLEAEVEVSAFVREFGLLVSDPQLQGMGEGEFSSEGFLQGWNQGNQFGYQAFLSEQRNEPVLSAPAAKIEAVWRWNFAKDDLQQTLGENVFVPRIVFLADGAGLGTTLVWGDGIPIALPEVDTVLIPREQLAPVKFLLRKKDIVSVAWGGLGPLSDPFRTESGALPYRLLSYDETPSSLSSFIKGLHPMPSKPAIVPVDKVLDAELIERARTKSS